MNHGGGLCQKTGAAFHSNEALRDRDRDQEEKARRDWLHKGSGVEGRAAEQVALTPHRSGVREGEGEGE